MTARRLIASIHDLQPGAGGGGACFLEPRGAFGVPCIAVHRVDVVYPEIGASVGVAIAQARADRDPACYGDWWMAGGASASGPPLAGPAPCHR